MSNEEDKEFIGLDVEQIAKILELEKQYPFVRKPGKQPPTFVSADRANNFISRLKQFYYPGDTVEDTPSFPILQDEIRLLVNWINFNNIEELKDLATSLRIVIKFAPEKLIDKEVESAYNRLGIGLGKRKRK